MSNARRRTAAAALTLAVLSAATVAATASTRTIPRSKALAVADAVAVRAADVPALRGQANPMTHQEAALADQVTKCIGGVAASEAYADTQSPAFVSTKQPTVGIVSGTEIMPSAALAARDLRAATGTRAPGCLLSAYESALRGSLSAGERVTSAKVARIPVVASGNDPSFAIRMTFGVSAPSVSGRATIAPFYIDDIGLGEGQIEVTLGAQTSTVKPSATLEHHLLDVLLARARAAAG